MNFQQLNQSGQNIWVFIVTGALALLITGVSWLSVEVITSYKGWTDLGKTDDSCRNESLPFRLALLLWLVKNGHWKWMYRSGAWLCILSNDKLGKFRVRRNLSGENACNYVYRSILDREEAWFNLNRIEWNFPYGRLLVGVLFWVARFCLSKLGLRTLD